MVQWKPKGRKGSIHGHGEWTVDVCGLRAADLIELYGRHVEKHVQPVADELFRAMKACEGPAIERALNRAWALFEPQMDFAALSYDALCELIPNHLLGAYGPWPEPHEVARP